MSTEAGGRSVTDAELIRYLDNELGEAERTEIAGRIARDTASSARLDTLAARSRELSGWLVSLDPAGHEVTEAGRAIRQQNVFDGRAGRGSSFRGVSPLLRAAAIILLATGTAMAVPASRAWLLQTIERAAHSLGITTTPEGAQPVDPAGAEVVHTFVVSGTHFLVEVAGAPTGTLVLERSLEDGATARVHAAGATQLTVLPAGLRIESAGVADAIYEITLPRSITHVLLRVAGEAEMNLTPGPHPWRHTIVLRD